jgi:hypothetical protein
MKSHTHKKPAQDKEKKNLKAHKLRNNKKTTIFVFSNASFSLKFHCIEQVDYPSSSINVML